MALVRDAGKSAEKWVRAAQAKTQDYSEGVQAPRADWATATKAAAGAYKQGVQDAIGKGRFEKGVAAAGTQKQMRKALEVGAPRYAQGVAAAQGEYQSGVQPYLDVIKNTALPPRGPKGSPGNIERVRVIATALRAKKETM